MPEIVRCPECNRQLRVPDNLLGKKVRCPGCKSTFEAKAAGAEEPPPAPAPPRPVHKKPAPPAEDFEILPEPKSPRKPSPPPAEQYEEAPRPERPRRPAPPLPDEPDFQELPPEEEEEEREGRRPRRRRRRSPERSPGWQKVRLGITLIIIGVFVGLAAVLIWGIGAVLTGALAGATSTTTTTTTVGSQTTTVRQSSAGVGALGIILIIFVVGMAIASRGLTVAGYGFCMPVPRASDAKMLANTSFILGIVNTFMPIITCVVAWLVVGAIGLALFSGETSGIIGGGIVMMILYFLMLVLEVCEVIAFLQFLRMISSHLGAEGLAKSINYLLILLVVILVLYLVMVGILMLGGSASTSQGFAAMGMALLGCSCVQALLSLGWFVWYIITLFFVRSTVSSHIAD